MNYIEEGKKPPKRKEVLSTPEELVEDLKPLIGQMIPMTGKPRTDGSNFRKIITNHLLSNYMPEAANEYEIIPPKQKGVPTFLREYIDTYIVTTGNSYNLQVWNRNPTSSSVQVELGNGEALLASDVSLPQEFLARGNEVINDNISIKDEPQKVLPIKAIDARITDKLIGKKLDISTIDLGKYSPQFEEQINDNFTTRTIRYLIALTDAIDGTIDRLIICPGEELGKNFTYVAEKSFKCQRSIPMSFFENYKGKVVFNP